MKGFMVVISVRKNHGGIMAEEEEKEVEEKEEKSKPGEWTRLGRILEGPEGGRWQASKKRTHL
jgi:hypothetical protein